MTTVLDRSEAAGFEAFMRCTDEKRELLKYLSSLVRSCSVRSLLHIGSGADDVPLELDALVKNYVAVEKRPKYAKRLRESGINVCENEFPFIGLENTYDMTLASHSVPRRPPAYRPFIHCAWQTLVHRGHLVLAQYDTERESEWGRFLVSADLTERHGSRIHMLRQWLCSLPGLGTFDEEALTTYVTSRSREQLIKALSFVYSDGRKDQADAFESSPRVAGLIEKVYCDGTEYCFPFAIRVFVLGRS